MLITIFTPAYNRAHLLQRLYDSLLKQDNQNFEWVLVDDGSSDNTPEIMEKFISENKIPIIFQRQKNSGKHIAINRGAQLANGELFFIVDSDDYLTSDATKLISEKYEKIKHDSSFAGVVGRKGYSPTEYIGSKIKYDDTRANAIDFRYRIKIQGDMAEVIKTSILKQYPFPVVENEKFCTEAVLWFKVAEKYQFLWFSNIIYIGEYLEGGLTYNSFKVRKNSPQYSTEFYSMLEKMNIPLPVKVKSNINFWRFAKYLKIPFSDKFKKVNPIISVIGFPLSLFFLLKDKK